MRVGDYDRRTILPDQTFPAMTATLRRFLFAPVAIAPLVTFRILLGGLLCVGALRFMAAGWIETLYVEPTFFFHFYGFAWAEPFGAAGMYALYSLIALSGLLVALGAFYRISAGVLFLSFTYAELVDATNYLNHYYLVCLLLFGLLFVPAHRAFSVDVRLGRVAPVRTVPAWCIRVFMAQLTLVYFYAGFAKLDHDWLFDAMPLAVWLPERTHLPVLGYFFQFGWVAYAFSWFGALYDLSIGFLLWNKTLRPWAYAAVIVFHGLTRVLFNIGLFPYIMIFGTLIFFSGAWHERLLGYFGYRPAGKSLSTARPALVRAAITVFFVFQLLFPLRFLAYPGKLLWTEQGYRFAWRVMLVEKSGQVTFTVVDEQDGRRTEISNGDYLTRFQEKQLAIQPDFILQFAHHLAEEYRTKHGFAAPAVYADAYVSLNGRRARRFVDPSVDLAAVQDGWGNKDWILDWKSEQQ